MRGFSLIELLVTISIVAILLGIAVPSYNFLFSKSQDQVMSDQLLRAINMARNEAIVRGIPVTLHKKTNWIDGYVLIAGENQIIREFDNPTHKGILHWRSFNQQDDNLQMLPSGLTHAGNGTFWYCAENTTHPRWAIVVSQSGRARLVYPYPQDQLLPC